MFNQIYQLAGLGQDDRDLRVRIAAKNHDRLANIVWIFFFVHLAHIVVFWPYTSAAATDTERWRNDVILVHVALLLLTAVLLFRHLLMKRRRQATGARYNAIPETVGLLYLLGAAALAIADQRVTSSISPLVVAPIGVGLVIIMRPIVAFCLYASILVMFLVGVAWVQEDPDLLLTVRVNSVTAICLGFGLSLLQWRNQTLLLLQQRRIHEQQRELEEKNQELTLLATRDPLTGLLNRGEFSREIRRELRVVQSAGANACLILMDVDHFKSINDTYGHPVGDRILVECAARMAEVLRSSDTLARVGGEEFAILLPGRTVAEGVHVAERLRTALCDRPMKVGEHLINVTACFGAAALATGSGDGISQSYGAADQALYQAKKDGRNRVRPALTPEQGKTGSGRTLQIDR